MSTKMKYILSGVFVVIVIIIAIIVLHKEDPTFSEYIENNIVTDNFRVEGDFAIYTEGEDNDDLGLIKNYFTGLGIKGDIFENKYVEVEDANYSETVTSNLQYGDLYYIISDSETGREFEAIVLDNDVLYEEIIY